MPSLEILPPSGPIENGTTYIVRPRMHPSNTRARVCFISAGSAQLLVGPASWGSSEQMKVRDSTRATSDSLERAITNLLDNAVKFSPPGGTIRVLLEGERLRISDQGPGIADEDLPHVFDRFWRSPSSRNHPGSGLGLSIVAQTIKAHGGWVKAGHSAEGGAEFIVRLPGSTTPPESDTDEDETVLLPRVAP